MAEEKEKTKPLDPVSIATWARLRSAGKPAIGGKPYGAEVSKPKPKAKGKDK